MAAERTDEDRDVEPGDVASMRPRPTGRGDVGHAGSSRRRSGRFNEAAAYWPRRHAQGNALTDITNLLQ